MKQHRLRILGVDRRLNIIIEWLLLLMTIDWGTPSQVNNSVFLICIGL